MVEQDAVRGVHAISLAVIHRDPIGVQLGRRVGAAWMERRGLALGRLLDQAVQLGRAGLVEAGLVGQLQDAQRLENAQRADAVGVGGVFRCFEADRHMALRRQIVDLVGLDLRDQAHQIGRIRHVAVMQLEGPAALMLVVIEMVDARGVEGRRPALHPVDCVALVQQQFGQIGPVLARDAGDERGFRHGWFLLCKIGFGLSTR